MQQLLLCHTHTLLLLVTVWSPVVFYYWLGATHPQPKGWSPETSWSPCRKKHEAEPVCINTQRSSVCGSQVIIPSVWVDRLCVGGVLHIVQTFHSFCLIFFFQLENMKYKDSRLKIMNEVLNGMKVIALQLLQHSAIDQYVYSFFLACVSK